MKSDASALGRRKEVLAETRRRFDQPRNAAKTSDSLALRFSELLSKLLNVLPRRLPIGIAGIAMKLERTSAQRRLKLFASKGNRLVVIIWARDFEFGGCGHWYASPRIRIDLARP